MNLIRRSARAAAAIPGDVFFAHSTFRLVGRTGRRRILSSLVFLTACLVVWTSASPLSAQGPDSGFANGSLKLHSFGRWSYGQTDGNVFDGGTEDGQYDNAALALNLSYSFTDALRVASQIELVNEPLEGELEVELDFVFASWDVSDSTALRLGRVKQPFGNYAEIYDVGTLRPFLDLPASLYGPAAVAGESVDGLAATFTRGLGEWSVAVDVYVGRLELEATEPWEALRDEDDEGDEEDEGEEAEEGLLEDKSREDLIGGRLVFTTPDQRLKLGASAYHGQSEGEGEGAGEAVDDTVFAVHLDFETDKTWIRAEAYHFEEEDEASADGAYLEVARFLDEHWQAAVRIDWLDTEISEVEIPDALDSLTEHRDVALGLNWWSTTDLVLKTAVHWVKGNRFALPEDLVESGELDDLEEIEDETLLFEIGVQFSF